MTRQLSILSSTGAQQPTLEPGGERESHYASDEGDPLEGSGSSVGSEPDDESSPDDCQFPLYPDIEADIAIPSTKNSSSTWNAGCEVPSESFRNL